MKMESPVIDRKDEKELEHLERDENGCLIL